MEKLFKLLANFLLIPLIKKFAEWVGDEYKKHKTNEQMRREAQEKQESYNNAPVDKAHDEFKKLP
jgi:hypothetical protein